MKLLFAIKTLSLAGGGAERVLAELASGLAARGHDVTVMSYDPPASSDFYAFHPDVRRIRLGIGSSKDRSRIDQTFQRIGALRREAKRVRPDAAIGFMHSAYIPLGLALLGTGIPVVASEHTVYSHYAGRPLQRMLLHLAPWLARAITDISEEARSSFPARIRRRMRIVPNPVAAAGAERADPIGGEEKILLAVGGLREEKGHRRLIAAFARLAPLFPDWTLRIVGEGPLRPALERQALDERVSERVALPGATANVDAEYLGAQLFVMPSSYESFGLATAEALAHGLAAVGFADCPGTNELIVDGENGLLVSGPDPIEALAEGLGRLMASPEERARMSAAAPRRLAAFAPERVLDIWEGLLAELAPAPAPGAVAAPPAAPPARAQAERGTPLKIVQMIPALCKGGAERVVVDLANHAARAGHRVTIVAAYPTDPALLPAALEPSVGLRYIAARQGRRLARYASLPPWLWKNRRWLAEQDVVHCHLTFSAAAATGIQALRRLARGKGPAVVETYHAVGVAPPGPSRSLHARLLARRDAFALMALDGYWRRFLEKRPKLPAAIIPNGVAFPERPPAAEAVLAYRRDEARLPAAARLVVGSVGRLAPERRPDLYIPVFAEIARTYGDEVRFLLAGAGPELPRIERLIAERGLESRVHLPGLAREPALPMALIDLYLTINVGPITGIAALEAAHAGVPVLALQLSSEYEMRADDWIWSSGDPSAVAREAIRLLGDPEARAELGARQSAFVRANHSVDVMARAYYALYERALARARPVPAAA